ncbi:ABC-2 type transport system permease protein [Thermomonospora echinospora]|uniref:ABC-2 type transport system permease protein n=1 Tax=Thermomonospora echinospora TaxID=1992 RepID=A0A1H6C7P5_9ACTN|nr:anibiotic ABC transporter [Thermomonospora echinospora]SEG68942.1 ABC-2 type transport system permease protein [Thermomonospora echinospora]
MGAFTGTARLARLALRRDRVQLPVWLVALTVTVAASASSVTSLYDTEQERRSYALTNAGSAVSRVFNGGLAEPSAGAIAMAETFSFAGVLIALMSLMAVVRHTRQNEETGRAELVGAAVVGRYAMLTAALLVTVAANAVLALLLAGALVAAGLPVAGSLGAGLAFGAVGTAFAGIAAVTAQVSQSARGANGLAGAVLGLMFLLRGIGDGLAEPTDGGLRVVSLWPSWLSPLGWGQQMQPYTGGRWWVLGLYAAFFAAMVWTAYRLTDHRDVGTGMMPVRRGPATAPRGLLSPFGLAWRLQRGVLLGWGAGVAVMAVSMGVLGDEAEELLGGNEDLEQYFAELGGGGANLVSAYFATITALFGIVITGYTVQALLRIRAEETGPLEAVLATAVSRPRWMLSHITCAVLGTVALLLLTGLGHGLSYGLVAGDMSQTPDLLGAALAQLPATLALAGVVVAVLGLLPRWAVALSWTALIGCLFTSQLGPVLELPQAVMNISPFTHVPYLPVADPAATPMVVLTAVGAALIAMGIGAFRNRDLAL